MIIVNTACEREEPSFISVELVTRSAIPLFSNAIHSCLDDTISHFKPSIRMLPFFSSKLVHVT